MKLNPGKALTRKAIVLLLLSVLLTTSIFGADAVLIDEKSQLLEGNAVPDAMASDKLDVVIFTPAGQQIAAQRHIGSSTTSTHPNEDNFNVTRIGNASNYYNCHAYAWYFGGSTSGLTNSSAFLINSEGVSDFISHTNCFELVLSPIPYEELASPLNKGDLEVGDIILYLNGEGEVTTEPYAHSAVIVSINGSGIFVNSKWGKYHLYRHEYSECPYVDTAYTRLVPPVDSDSALVCVYRPVHNNVDNSIVPTATDATTYVFPSYVSVDGSSHKAVCDCGRGYEIESHDLVQITTYKYKCRDCNYVYDSSTSINSVHNVE